MSQELKPCPFCGGKAKVSSFPGAHNVWCENQPVGCGNRAMFTVEQWNTRAAPTEDARAVVDEPVALMYDDGDVLLPSDCLSREIFDTICRRNTPLYRHPQRPVVPLDPVEGDVLPPVGSTVQIQLGDSGWFDHTVTGYYAWPNHGLDKNVHRVFIRVKDAGGTPNARMLNDIRQSDPTTSQ